MESSTDSKTEKKGRNCYVHPCVYLLELSEMPFLWISNECFYRHKAGNVIYTEECCLQIGSFPCIANKRNGDYFITTLKKAGLVSANGSSKSCLLVKS
jgi:hypothetical protein